MPMHRFRKWISFGLGGGGGGGGGGTDFAQLKCVWAKNMFGSQRKSLTLDIIIPTTRSMLWCNFLWGLRNWLHKTRPPYFGSIHNIDVETHVTTRTWRAYVSG